MAQKIIVGITQGDSNGIGYEVIIKALSDPRMAEICTPVVYGSSRIFGFYRKQIPEAEQINTNVINSAADAHPKRVNLINCVPDNLSVEPGQPAADGAKAAIASLEAATADLLEGKIDCLVTAPINKESIQKAGFKFPGHTEYLTSRCNESGSLMFLCTENMKVGLVTNHIPLEKVAETINKDLIVGKLRLMKESLCKDFCVVRPKIAVLGLNPHAGDGGALGNAETEVIAPAIEAANGEGIMAFGPYSPDGFFGNNMQYKFDAVLAMYHDQGLIPFKALAFDRGVNFTAGLPVVRTSPDHGTGFDLAGRNSASAQSMLSAIYMAIDICRSRENHEQMFSNPMEVKHFEGPRHERTIVPE